MLVVMGVGFMGGSRRLRAVRAAADRRIVGGIWLVMGVELGVLLAARAARPARRRAAFGGEGTAATATLLGRHADGLHVNSVPQWALQMRIDGAGASYETPLKVLTYTPPGQRRDLGVRVDPVKRDHVVLSGDDDASASLRAANTAGLGRGGGAAAAPQVQAAVLEALRQAGLAQGETAVVNPDGSRTITTSSVTIGSDADAGGGPADTVRLLADLDKLRADGSLSEAEFAAVKAKLLGRL